MAAPITRNCLRFVVKCCNGAVRNLRTSRSLISWRVCSTSSADGSKERQRPERDLEELFLRPDVQRILKRITGFDLERIFRRRQVEDLSAPKYKLLTEKQLKKFEGEAEKRGRDLLQMPPVKRPWGSHDTSRQVVSADHDIADFELSSQRYVFTDISYGLPRRNRVVVVRELDGILRLADHEERDRILQVYYPSPGKMYHMPKMFLEENLEKVLAEHRYEYALDRACVQFEPDDPNYIRVTQRTYEHVASCKKFDDLRSTRHFGPMSFYFAFNRKIDPLLIDMLQSDLLKDAEDLVTLYHILHPDCQSAVEARKLIMHGIALIQLFAKHDAINGGVIEMALQSYEEAHQVLQRSESS